MPCTMPPWTWPASSIGLSTRAEIVDRPCSATIAIDAGVGIDLDLGDVAAVGEGPASGCAMSSASRPGSAPSAGSSAAPWRRARTGRSRGRCRRCGTSPSVELDVGGRGFEHARRRSACPCSMILSAASCDRRAADGERARAAGPAAARNERRVALDDPDLLERRRRAGRSGSARRRSRGPGRWSGCRSRA